MNKKAKIIITVLAVCVAGLVAALIGLKVNESHYKLYKNIISQEEVEETLFNQPISEERLPR